MLQLSLSSSHGVMHPEASAYNIIKSIQRHCKDFCKRGQAVGGARGIAAFTKVMLTFLTPPLSLTTTTSSGESLRPCQQRRKFLPILPKPLMATFNLATVSPFTGPADPVGFLKEPKLHEKPWFLYI
uniref:Uncharacterized protein n=1 Tax=Solanum lycopersicum TaxID=4081 RepID=A0A3Q7JE73_SOLLC